MSFPLTTSLMKEAYKYLSFGRFEARTRMHLLATIQRLSKLQISLVFVFLFAFNSKIELSSAPCELFGNLVIKHYSNIIK